MEHKGPLPNRTWQKERGKKVKCFLTAPRLYNFQPQKRLNYTTKTETGRGPARVVAARAVIYKFERTKPTEVFPFIFSPPANISPRLNLNWKRNVHMVDCPLQFWCNLCVVVEGHSFFTGCRGISCFMIARAGPVGKTNFGVPELLSTATELPLTAIQLNEAMECDLQTRALLRAGRMVTLLNFNGSVTQLGERAPSVTWHE